MIQFTGSDGSELNKEVVKMCLHKSAIRLDVDDGPIMIWCLLPFHHLWNGMKGTEGFIITVMQLMQKTVQ